MRDQMNSLHPVTAIAPVASAGSDAALATAIIDTQGYDSLTFFLMFGAIPDADATFAVTGDHGDVSNLAGSTAIAATDIVGTLALAAPLFSDDGKVKKIGYIGSKRYVRLTVTPTNNTGATLHAILAVLGRPRQSPTANPSGS